MLLDRVLPIPTSKPSLTRQDPWHQAAHKLEEAALGEDRTIMSRASTPTDAEESCTSGTSVHCRGNGDSHLRTRDNHILDATILRSEHLGEGGNLDFKEKLWRFGAQFMDS